MLFALPHLCTTKSVRNFPLPRRRPRARWEPQSRAPRRSAATVLKSSRTSSTPELSSVLFWQRWLKSSTRKTEKIALLAKRTMELAQVRWKRRRRTKYFTMPGIMENVTYLAPSAWLHARRACLPRVRCPTMLLVGEQLPCASAQDVLRTAASTEREFITVVKRTRCICWCLTKGPNRLLILIRRRYASSQTGTSSLFVPTFPFR